jgi:hypothetical protein
MSKANVRTAITFLVVVGVVVAVYVMPKMLKDQAVQDAVHDAVENAARDAARKVAAEAVPEAAKEIADQARSEAAKQGPAPVTNTPPIVLERAAYKITMPGDSTVDPEDKDVDKDHYTSVNLPTGGTFIITVTDQKELAGAKFDKINSDLKARFLDATVADTHTFDPARAVRSTAISGKLEGRRFVFETAQCDGNTRACLMILEYSEEKKTETLQLVRTALATFKMKD